MTHAREVGSEMAPSSVMVNDVKVELIRHGTGPSLLFLHPILGVPTALPVLKQLAQRFDVIAPSLPGFGRSELPKGMTTVDDVSYFYLDLLAALELERVCIVGVSFGAWLAAEIAVKTCERITHLVLADPVGVKHGGPDEVEIVDVFSLTDDDLDELVYADSTSVEPPGAQSTHDERVIAARNRESAAWFGWAPYMHNPRLRGRLHRITVPTLLLWGEQDGIVSRRYVEGWCNRIGNAHMATIGGAGHYPHVEAPDVFVERVNAFMTSEDSTKPGRPGKAR
jgi:pimeloyl-ACP methyl ester carboxylesterase